MKDLNEAIAHYKQFKENKTRDKHMDGFEKVFREELPAKYELRKGFGIQETSYRKKKWDYSVWENSKLVGVIELKSLHKSADKNINNRQEEACQVLFIMTHRPSVKRSYFWIGDTLSENTKNRWEDFFQDCLSNKWYHSIGTLLLDGNEDRKSFKGMSIEDMFSLYNKEQQ